ncbi:hypothetical protein CRG98_040561 [Punica granatum]|uniref:Uncharacterized protein n=1 Tax=Punica granatum TaxID=22663 RepID=A0A2I0I5U8_PUNGR|nr:hypothetical protein CRG98_040561 [Punica granatum]
MKLNSHGLADRARLQEAPARWLGELKVQESKTAQTRLGYKRHEGGGSANLRCKKVISHGLADPARLHDARARRLGELAVQESKLAGVSIPDKCRKVSFHGLADRARVQEARARWLGELAVQESNLARVSRPDKVARGTSQVARRTCSAGKKVSFDGLAIRARLQEARARWFGELAVQEIKLARVSRPINIARGRSEWLGELAVQEIKLARVSRPINIARGRSEWLGELAVQEIKLARVSRPINIARGRSEWLGELAVQEIKLARVNRPRKVERGQSEVARRSYGQGK